jgi:hypothetical protein
MSRHIQVTFDAHDPHALSSFWRDVLGYIHPGPPGVDLPEDADPLAAVALTRAWLRMGATATEYWRWRWRAMTLSMKS